MNIDYKDDIDLAKVELMDNLTRQEKDMIRRWSKARKRKGPRIEAKPPTGTDLHGRIAWQVRRLRDSRNLRFRKVAQRPPETHIFVFFVVLFLSLYYVLYYNK